MCTKSPKIFLHTYITNGIPSPDFLNNKIRHIDAYVNLVCMNAGPKDILGQKRIQMYRNCDHDLFKNTM